MTLRDDLVPLVDDMRQLVDDLGLRRHVVIRRIRTWDGAEVGLDKFTDADVIALPPPKVDNEPNRKTREAGASEEGGGIVIRKLSVAQFATENDLVGSGLAPNVELFWLIDGEPYRVTKRPEKRNFEWQITVERIHG